MLSIATGYDPRYLTGEVAKGTENYYTREVGRGEPPGVWNGRGAAELGLVGEVRDDEMEALFVHFVDPRDPAFRGGSRRDWLRAAKLGRPPRSFKTPAEHLAELLAAEPGAEPERVEQLRRLAERRARKPVAFLDLTFGVPKSFSILHTAFRAQEQRARAAGNDAHAKEWSVCARMLEEAVWAGNNAALEFLQEHAGFSRAGYHGIRSASGDGVGRWVDAHGWIVASFLQHTNRNEDMHLHIHNAVLNRVRCADGKWRTLDSRAIHKLRGTAGVIAERVMTEHAIAALQLRTEWSPDGNSIELADVPLQARRLFSSRRHEVTEATKRLAKQWAALHGREPNSLELWHLGVQASKATRGPKRHEVEGDDTRLRRWDAMLRTDVDSSLHHIAHTAPGANRDLTPAAFDPDEVIGAAVQQVQAGKSVWTRYDLIRALHNHLPTHLGLDAHGLVRLLHALADRALDPAWAGSDVLCLSPPELVPVPGELRLADGRSVFEPPASTLYANRAHLAEEEALVHAAVHAHTVYRIDSTIIDTTLTGTGAAQPTVTEESAIDTTFVDTMSMDSIAVDAEVRASRLGQNVVSAGADVDVAAAAEDGSVLGADQRAAVRGLLSSPRRIGVLVGPAGAGKSTVLAHIARLWQQHIGGNVVGLATGQHAANLLQEEGLPLTDNVFRWLQRQTRLAEGRPVGDDEHYRLKPTDVVVVDEASMTPTADLAAVEAQCAAVGARLIVAGDERQLGSVGAGGAFRLLIEHGNVHRLDEVRRFHQPWESGASLRLRGGDTDVISVYERHGRIVDGGTPEHTSRLAADAWLADTLGDLRSLLLVDTGEQAAELSARMRARLVDLGHVQPEGVALHHPAAAGTTAGVGDIVQSRRNDWTILDSEGRPVVNRDLWQVTAITGDGGLIVRRIVNGTNDSRALGGTAVLPREYVSAHVTLGYALTVHAAQGLTVDTCYPIITGHTTPAALYVGMTRGRRHNVAHIVTNPQTAQRTRPPVAAQHNPDGHVATPDNGEVSTPGQVLDGIMRRDSHDIAAIELHQQLLIESGSMPVLASRWSEAVSLAGQRRFEATLHDLAGQGHISNRLARRIRGDHAAGALQRLLRTCELAGHDPQRVLAEAVGERELGTAISPAEVLHWRITNRYNHNLTPTGDNWAARTPHGDDPISTYASQLAGALDERCAYLGGLQAQQPNQWALVHLGPVPDDETGRKQWQHDAGIVAGYREHQQTAGDAYSPIGACPQLGQPEARAAWFAAWRALGSPTPIAPESTMTVEELVHTITTYQQLHQQAPAWAGDQLRYHHHATRHHLQQARLLAAQAHAEAVSDTPHRNDLLDRAAWHQARSEAHAHQADQLTAADQLRARWYRETEPARQAARLAAAELRRRGLGDHEALPAIEIHTGEAAASSDMASDAPSLVAIAFPHDLRTALAMAAAQADTARLSGAQPERERPAPSRSAEARDRDYEL